MVIHPLIGSATMSDTAVSIERAERLLEGIEATIQLARDAGGGEWTSTPYGVDGHDGQPLLLTPNLVDSSAHVHAAWHDPASVLRLCAAHQRIVEEYLADPGEGNGWGCAMENVIGILAEGYGVLVRQDAH